MSTPDEDRQRTPRISLCMILKDEETFLAGCLDSAKESADEVIVVDTGSKDRTIQIAVDHGALVHEFQWTDSFSDARNSSLEHATGDWILILDADERLDPEAARAIRKAVDVPDVDAWLLTQRGVIGSGAQASVGEYSTCRLFRNLPEYRYEGPVHEHVLHSIKRAGGEVRSLDAVIQHLGYGPQVTDSREKHELYVRLLTSALETEPDNFYYMQTLAAAYCVMGEYERALPYLEKAAGGVAPGDGFGDQVHTGISATLSALGRPQEAVDAVEKALQAGFRHPTLWFNKGNALSQLGLYSEAISAFGTAIGTGSRGTWNGDTGTFGYKAQLGIASAHEGLGDLESAVTHFLAALDAKSDCAPALNDLGRIYATLNRPPEAIECFTKSIKIEPDSPAPYFNAGDLLYALGMYDEAAGIYQAGLEHKPDHADGFFALANCWFRLGAHEAAASAYKHSLSLDPLHQNALANLSLAEDILANRAA